MSLTEPLQSVIACALRTRHCGHRTVRSLRPAGLPPAEQMTQLRCAVVLRTPYGVRVRGQAPQHPKGCFFHVFDRTPAINDCVRPAHTTLRTPHSLTRHLLLRQNKKTQLRCERGAKINEPCDSAANEEHGECPYFCDAKRRSCGRGASGRLFAPAASANILRRGGGGNDIKH